MDDKIKSIMSAVLDIDSAQIDNTTAPDTLEQWDSLKHMSLVIALEEEFGIQFEDEEIVKMLSFPLIKETLSGKGIG